MGILEKDGWRVIVDFKAFYISESYYSDEIKNISKFYSLRSKEIEIANDLIPYLEGIIKTK